MTGSRIIVVGLLTFYTLPVATNAQGLPHFVEKLTISEGLNSNVINDLVQDDNGFLWIATPDGLNRFDGTETVHFMHQQGLNSLAHSYINCLLKLPDHTLAIGTQAGISFYNPNTGIFLNFYSHHQPSLDLYNNMIGELTIDAFGNCWAASRSCIYIFDRQHQLKKIIPAPFDESVAAKERLSFVEKMVPLSNGDVLLCLYTGWSLFSAATDTLIQYERPPPFLPPANPGSFPAARIFKLFSDHFLSIPPGSDSLYLFDEQAGKKSSCYFPYNKYPFISWSQQLVTIDSNRLLLLLHNYGLLMISLTWRSGIPRLSSLSPLLFDENEYKTALCDRQGNWWLATTKEGLQKISPTRQSFIGAPLIDRQTKRPIRYEVLSCNRLGSTLWVCTYGEGFFEIDLSTGRQIQHRLTGTGGDTWANFVWNTSRQNKDTLFLGTQVGLYGYSTRTGKSGRLSGYPGKPPVLDSVAITTQFVDSHGLLWMGLGKGRGLCIYDQSSHRFSWYPGNTASGYPLRYPTDITEDSKKDLWFTNDGSNLLVHWDRRTGIFTPVALPATIQKQVGPLRGICSQGDSLLWIGDITGGLIKYHLRHQTLDFYGREHGLSNCHISDIHEDHRKRLWLVTEGGLVCFDPQTGIFANFTTKDGLPVSYPTSNLFYDDRAKRFYTGGHGAWFYFDPDGIFPGRSVKNTLITALLVNGAPWPLNTGASTVFHSQQNDITIQYAAVDLVDGPSTRYFYRLLGADTGWMSAGKQRQINFSHLQPGHYTFQVRAANLIDAVGSPTAGFSFRINPPFTQTAFFYALIGLILAIGLFILYRYRRKQSNQTMQVRREISRNLHDEVGANLTNISLSSLLAQRQLQNDGVVGKILERIYQDSQLVSESMREIVWSINPRIDTLGEALPRMLHYASNLLEANNIELQAEISPDVERLRLTMKQRRDVYLIFKEAINNMVRHSNATRALVQFYLSGKTLTMKIADNGTGFDPIRTSENNGLKNMQERARQHRWKLKILSHPQEGTTITLDTS
ncbi:ligand-binding sensor domain-containing protein [Puia sp.]|jgi:ligand-binding sensor domain-containing protein/two-component sensor histidine kinase|uniref:ligand-binding sensor domain-containing protein n=1 Tax=Puia sp. TaxID=2045100 RepID=UPI002F40C3EA